MRLPAQLEFCLTFFFSKLLEMNGDNLRKRTTLNWTDNSICMKCCFVENQRNMIPMTDLVLDLLWS